TRSAIVRRLLGQGAVALRASTHRAHDLRTDHTDDNMSDARHVSPHACVRTEYHTCAFVSLALRVLPSTHRSSRSRSFWRSHVESRRAVSVHPDGTSGPRGGRRSPREIARKIGRKIPRKTDRKTDREIRPARTVESARRLHRNVRRRRVADRRWTRRRPA